MVMRWTADTHTQTHTNVKFQSWIMDLRRWTIAPVADFNASLFGDHVGWKVAITSALLRFATTKPGLQSAFDLRPHKPQVTYYVKICLVWEHALLKHNIFCRDEGLKHLKTCISL